jgi:hypothetical protein
MKKHLLLYVAFAIVVLGFGGVPISADFVQCLGDACDGTDNPDIINGSPLLDIIDGFPGDDIIFGGAGPDEIVGDEGNDLIFGGMDSDAIGGDLGNDILFPGPDTTEFSQIAFGGEGNDVFNVLVGDVSACLIIRGGEGFDVVNLIGFGPYIAEEPFGPLLVEGWVRIVDPVAGGKIFINVGQGFVLNKSQPKDDKIEKINGLLFPDVIILTEAEAETENETCPVMPVEER